MLHPLLRYYTHASTRPSATRNASAPVDFNEIFRQYTTLHLFFNKRSIPKMLVTTRLHIDMLDATTVRNTSKLIENKQRYN